MSDKPINEYLAHLLVQANRQVNRQLSLEGITLEHWRVLKVISDRDGVTMRELSEELMQNFPTLTKIIDKMVLEALVYRVPDEQDRRKVRLYITEKGKGILEQQNDRVNDHQVKIEDTYGSEEAQMLKEMLEQFIKSRS
ncbi:MULTISPECIES: MarR family winged helix-turn-helix transcriptional regulator [Klebsiella]|uniref:MarR family winged helix-turn-helix transcriptional regulator n=1 Tax=Klebsiella TaxID=570 RepID=UPI000D74C57C|nr:MULTISPECIES: MarR family transcriptional regulator [Klebsiella]MBZ7591964.1 MarR family transcriptional regulator [Klebsiella oxytoca]MCI7875949.1 MarR family transcriptional regulator [Klebsiella pneumoniae]MCI7906423.1 MarR family transcriptional regulator [Klebsiella pneumoniae]MCP3439301.1 MarR family transcriptional regulator [Klebsiella variicola]MCP5602150.1 MarR family transcriptional regulator [Klebsiella pneumoniae]